MKLIDADKLIKEVQEEIEVQIKINKIKYDKCNKYFIRGMKWISDIISYQPTVNQWIPCKERLPKESGNYIATTKVISKLNETYYDVIEATYWSSTKTWEDTVDDISLYVIAWQPLPKPYEE